jgi:hypothetical protein
MTGRTLAFTAIGTVLVALVAVAVLPLVSHHSPGLPTAPDTPSSSMPLLVSHVAQRTARADLRCPTSRRPSVRSTSRPADCGTLQISRSQTSCGSATRCTVDLIGELQTSGLVIPIALTTTLTGSGAAWHVIEVAS